VRSKPAARLASCLATFFGAGYAPLAPGTAGSLAALAVAAALARFANWGRGEMAMLAAAAFLPAVWAAHVFAGRAGKKDPGQVVVDEVIGQWATLAGAAVINWKSLLGAFVLFRALDILKPFPIRRAERLPGGLGIVADDAAAGLAGALILYAAGCFNLY